MSLSQASKPAFHMMAKPTGPIYNLGCKYCFYLEKELSYPLIPDRQRSW
jgi:sulfatase maturation enzyme AslB (radical SAM superfamily)